MQAAEKHKNVEPTVYSLSALENCVNQGRFLMTKKKASVTSRFQGERAQGRELYTRFRSQGSSGLGLPPTHFKAREGEEKDNKNSVWISQDKSCLTDLIAFYNGMTDSVDEGTTLHSFIFTLSRLLRVSCRIHLAS